MSTREEELELEETFSKYELIPFLIKRAKELTEQYPQLDQDSSALILAFFLMEKRMKPEEIFGRVYNKIKDVNKISSLLDQLIELNLLIWDEDRQELITAYRLSDEDENARLAFMYPMPMIIEPEKVTNNYQTGYIKTRYGIICRNKSGLDDYNLDHINRVNSVAFKINGLVLNKCKNKNKNAMITEQQKRNFNKFSTTQKVIAQSFLEQGKFWFTHRYDKRGRYYPTGYYLNYQGNDFGKALIEFADGEKLDS